MSVSGYKGYCKEDSGLTLAMVMHKSVELAMDSALTVLKKPEVLRLLL